MSEGEEMSGDRKHKILLVDDEENITRALKRLLRREGWRIETCNSGPAALALLSESDTPFSLIISDQRMPEMNGSEFLEKSTEIMPGAIRFLLTGYSDIKAVEEALNKGRIKRYLTKPWDDEAILLHIRDAIEEIELRRENERLTKLTQKQNRQLYDIGVTLEKKVRDRTRELKEKSVALEGMNRKLEKSFRTTVLLLVSMIEAGDKILGGYLRQAGRLSKKVALHLGLEGGEVETIEMAGLLHDMGLFGMPGNFLQHSESDLSPVDLRRFRQHPILAAHSMEAIDKLADAGRLVHCHHERYDGKGFPEHLKGEDIPMGARIVSAVSEYCRIFNYWPDNIQDIIQRAKEKLGISMDETGSEGADALLQVAAERLLKDGILKKYDEKVVHSLIAVTRESRETSSQQRTRLLPIKLLQPGMVIPQDLFLSDGRMLLAQSTVLDEAKIQTIQKMGRMKMVSDSISVTH